MFFWCDAVMKGGGRAKKSNKIKGLRPHTNHKNLCEESVRGGLFLCEGVKNPRSR